MKTVLNVKTDREIKRKAQKVAKELGVPLSIVVNTYLKAFIRDKEVLISNAPRMTPKLEEIITEAEADYKAGRNISPPLSTPEEIEDYLNSP